MKTILFLDDEHALRTVCSEVLRHNGYRVLESADMAQAVRACREYRDPIDLSIVNATFGTSIKRLAEDYPKMGILFIGEPQWKARIRRLRGFKTAWLPRPFTSEELLETVHLLADDRVSHAGK